MDWLIFWGWTLDGIILLNIVLAIAVIFIERRDAGATWAWLLILFFLPVVKPISNRGLGSLQSQKNRTLENLRIRFF